MVIGCAEWLSAAPNDDLPCRGKMKENFLAKARKFTILIKFESEIGDLSREQTRLLGRLR